MTMAWKVLRESVCWLEQRIERKLEGEGEWVQSSEVRCSAQLSSLIIANSIPGDHQCLHRGEARQRVGGEQS